MSGFTPGPWTAYEFGADWWVATDADDSGPMLRVGSIHADREANAHLIAAAPELYEALAGMVEWNIKRGPFDEPLGESEQDEEVNAAVRALRKARGETA